MALGGRATKGMPLGPLTTYGVGGAAALFMEVQGPEDLEALRTACASAAATAKAEAHQAEGLPVFVIGRGSNVLVADSGFVGLVLRLGSGFSRLELPERGPSVGGEGPAVVTAGAAVALPVLARRAADAGWQGLSWAVGVPGSVGGAVRMNAGGHGSDMASCLFRYRWVDLLSGAGGTDDATRLAYGYRSSSVTASQVVVEADLEVTPGSADEERGRGGLHRQMASRAPARRVERRFGVHQPRG